MTFSKLTIKQKMKFFVLTLILIAILFGLFEIQYSDKYYPGIMIAGKSVGGKTYNEVLQEFTSKTDALQKNGLNLVLEKEGSKKEINIPASTSALTIDALVEYFYIGDFQKIASDAFSWGRKGSLGQMLKEKFSLILGKDFDSPISLHKESVQSLLSRETRGFFKTAVPAQFAFNNSEVVIVPEKLGDNFDTESVLDVIGQKFDSFEIEPIIFKIQTQAPYTTQKNLEPFTDLAKKVSTDTNIKFYYKNYVWKVSGKKLITWLILKPEDQITIDNKKLEAFLSTSVVPLINDPPQNSRFKMVDGSLVEISPGKSGNIVDIKETIGILEGVISKMQQASISQRSFTAALIESDPKVQINSIDGTVEIPIKIIEVEPEVTQKTIDQYNITDLIGYARTNFTGGSQDRQHNIEIGVEKLTGMLIAPGQEFSAANGIGEVTEEEGFVKEYVIKEGQTIKELGGGLCQLATTLFRMALNAGLPITERVNHRYVIPYYGPGLDATIYGPHPDFRFVNDTGNYVLLQGNVKNNEVIFELYGVSDGRVAKVSEPILSDEKPVPENRYILSNDLAVGQTSCTSITHKGITADVTYTVNYADGTIKENSFHSVYEAWPKICLVGTLQP